MGQDPQEERFDPEGLIKATTGAFEVVVGTAGRWSDANEVHKAIDDAFLAVAAGGKSPAQAARDALARVDELDAAHRARRAESGPLAHYHVDAEGNVEPLDVGSHAQGVVPAMQVRDISAVMQGRMQFNAADAMERWPAWAYGKHAGPYDRAADEAGATSGVVNHDAKHARRVTSL